MKLPQLTDTGEWTTRRYLSLLGTVLIWIIVAIDAWYLWPSQLGGHTSMVIVSGESMEPTYFDGDLVIARKMEPSIGDVIIYAPEGLGGSQIVHRIIGGNAEDGWELQGDNNDFVDPFTPKGDEVKGVVLVHYSNFGRVTVLLLNPMVWAFVLLAAIVLLLWWSDDCDDDDDDDAESDSEDGEPDDTTSLDAAADDEAPDTEVLDPEPSNEPRGADEAAVPVARMSPWKRTVRRSSAVVLGTLVAAGVMAGPASASQLAISASAAPYVATHAKCDALSLAATASGTPSGGSYTAVSVAGFTSACQGVPATVTLYNSSGSVIASGSTASTSATTTFGTSSYTGTAVADVVVKIHGWVFVPSWTPPAPPSPATCVPTDSNGNVVVGTCTVTSVRIVNTWGEDGGRGANANFTATSSSGWFIITFDFSQPPFPGWIPKSIGGNLTLPPITTCSASPVVSVRGPSWSNYQSPSYQYYFGFYEEPGNICSS